MWIKPIKEWSKWIDCISRKYGRSPKNNQHYHWFRNDWNQPIRIKSTLTWLWLIIYESYIWIWVYCPRDFSIMSFCDSHVRNDQLITGVANFIFLTGLKIPTGSIILKTGSGTFERFLAEWIILGDSDSTWQC